MLSPAQQSIPVGGTFSITSCSRPPSDYNFCFNDDFVPQVPLTNWGYGKHGITYTITAGNLYNNNISFKNDMKRFVFDSKGRNDASFNLSGTNNLLSHVSNHWGSVQAYYTLIHKNATNTNHTLYTFFRNIVAPAAMDESISDQLALFGESGNTDITYYTPIAQFFVYGGGAPLPGWQNYIYDTHHAFTYYAVVRRGLFT